MTPVLIGVVASFVVGGQLALLQLVVWITPLFEVATGIAIGLALVPLRRHADGTEEFLKRSTIACVAVTFFIYILVSCLLRGTSPVDLLAATTVGRSGSVGRTGLGSIAFLGSCVGAFFAARKTLEVARDETLDRW